MKSLIAWVLAMVGVAGMAWAQESGPVTRPATQPAVGPMGLMGTVAKVEGKTLIVTPMKGLGDKDVALPTDERTTFMVDYESGKLEDVKPDMAAQVRVIRGTRGRPDRMIVTATSQALVGQVRQVEGKKVVIFGRVDRSWRNMEAAVEERDGRMSMRFTLKGRPEEPKECTVETDEWTKVLIMGTPREPGRDGTLEDLKPDTIVHVIPDTGTAKKIIIGLGTVGGPMLMRPGMGR